jgi:hypothetical protein
MTIGGIGRDAQLLQLGDSGGSVKRPPPPTDTITTGCRLWDPQARTQALQIGRQRWDSGPIHYIR